MEKQELQALRLWNPLFPKIYRKNEWGDTENEPENMDANEIVEYLEEILAAIEREKLPNEGERVWLFTLIMMFLREKCIVLILLLGNGMASCGVLQKYSHMAN